MDRQTDMMVLSDRDWGEEGWTGHSDRQTGLQSDSGQERRGMDRQTDRQTDKQTETNRMSKDSKSILLYFLCDRQSEGGGCGNIDRPR